MPEPREILDLAYGRAEATGATSVIGDTAIADAVRYICRCNTRAGVRLLMACLVAKIHQPGVDIRKPYTEIEGADCYSGRVYDESHLWDFICKHNLPCNPTTAFLTPCLRNINQPLTCDIRLLGQPALLYERVIQLLDYVQNAKVTAKDLLTETIRCLIEYRNEREHQLKTLLAAVKSQERAIPLSAEAIISLLEQHLRCPKSSRLPVLVVAACYNTAKDNLGEQVLPLMAHNAADRQTGTLGDVNITLRDDEGKTITSYEMKQKPILRSDIDVALRKVTSWPERIDNYIFITTEKTEDDVVNYAMSLYESTGGIEFVILDCISFLRHFLHFFHRLRLEFVEEYQNLILEEDESGVSHALKAAFLALRQATESNQF